MVETLRVPSTSIDSPSFPFETSRGLGVESFELIGDSINLHFRESDLGDIPLRDVLDSLVPSYREALTLIPIPTYLGRYVIQPKKPGVASGCLDNIGDDLGKYYSWSKGRGFEYSPIKTRSAC